MGGAAPAVGAARAATRGRGEVPPWHPFLLLLGRRGDARGCPGSSLRDGPGPSPRPSGALSATWAEGGGGVAVSGGSSASGAGPARPRCPPSCWGWARPRQRCFPVSPGIIEGFKVEKAGLQEALGQKEAAERDLVVQLESLSQQLQRAARQQAELEEENAGLWHQKEAAAAEAQAREAGRRREGGRAWSRRGGGGAAGCLSEGALPRGAGRRSARPSPWPRSLGNGAEQPSPGDVEVAGKPGTVVDTTPPDVAPHWERPQPQWERPLLSGSDASQVSAHSE